jgi:hypothetical protein
MTDERRRHMSVGSIRSRLRKVERKIQPRRDASFTLEELCRSMWREDKRKFLQTSSNTSIGFFARQFEIEDVERRRRPPDATTAKCGLTGRSGRRAVVDALHSSNEK